MAFKNVIRPPSGPATANPHQLAILLGIVVRWLWDAHDVVNGIMRGKINSTGSLTLAANAETTVFHQPLIGGSSVILLQPATANAAAELAGGRLYFDVPGNGSVVIHHQNSAASDRTFGYAIFG
jgi:hypothetical protein